MNNSALKRIIGEEFGGKKNKILGRNVSIIYQGLSTLPLYVVYCYDDLLAHSHQVPNLWEQLLL